jgi:hypothetical protein
MSNKQTLKTIRHSGLHISFGGPARKINDITGKLWHFEMHRYCGPAATTIEGEILDKQPPAKSPFWTAVTAWAQQGQKIEDGLCVWTKPVEPKLVHIIGKYYAYEGSSFAFKYGKATK